MKGILLSIIIVALSAVSAIADTFESWDLPGDGYGTEVLGIAMLSDTDGFALMRFGNVFHWNGEDWTQVTVLDGQYLGMEYYDSTHIYAHGFSQLYMYDGSSWVEFSPAPPSGVNDISVISPQSIWVYGGDVKDGKYLQDLHHWDGVSWTTYEEPPGFEDLYINCLGFGASDDGWAGGDGGTMAHFYDGEWHAYDSPTVYARTCSDFANPNYGAMDGYWEAMIYYNGNWYEYPYQFNFTADYAINDEYIVNVCEDYFIIVYHYSDDVHAGNTGGIPLYSVHATSPHSIWAGGEDGYVCHWVWSDEDIQPTSLGEIKAQYPPVSGTSSSITPPKTKNDWNRLCPQLEFEK
jgi:hypothetical protein